MAEASTFLDQLLVDLVKKKELQHKRLPKEKERTVELTFVNSSMVASEKLKKTLDKEKSDFKTRATNISQWQQNILILKKQIEGLEHQISEAGILQVVGFSMAEKALNDEALVGVVHLKCVNALNDELA